MTEKNAAANFTKTILTAAGEFEFECFPNPKPTRDYIIKHVVHEGTSVCPKTGQPDFWTLDFEMVAGASCVELKSLKMYLQAFRNMGIFYEQVTNAILDDMVLLLAPKELRIKAVFSTRGGIHSEITAAYSAARTK